MRIEEKLSSLEKENEDFKKSILMLTNSLVITAKSLEEIALIQKNHLTDTQALMIVIEDLNSLINPKNNLLKYDLLNEPHN